jgi:NadR type nicotinamide-nucleotide adenylyltransferase
MEKTTDGTTGIVRIAITGPESTGKSWLARHLAEYYQTCYVPEFAREYLNSIKRPYTYEDLAIIARGQMKAEDTLAPEANRVLFCDTDLSVLKIWSEVKYGKGHEWILSEHKRRQYSLHLLCNIDLPWEDDPLREHPAFRQELLDKYTSLLCQEDRRYTLIGGLGEQRLKQAIHAVDKILKEQKR